MKDHREVKKRNITVIVISAILLISAFTLTYHINHVIDGERVMAKYEVPIDGNAGNLVFYVWEPLEGSPDRGDRVVFLFAGFLAQQTMMFPLAREFTRLGYHVVTGDFRGHGMSDGIFPTDWSILLTDFDTFYFKVKEMYPHWNWTHISVVGHSMGGYASTLIGNNRSSVVFNTVAMAPAPSKDILNSSIRNYMLLIGGRDQAFSAEKEREFFRQALPGSEIGQLYGNPLDGTARKMVVEPSADHLSELYNDNLLSEAVSFVEMGYGFTPVNETPTIRANQQTRLFLVYVAMFLGFFGIIPLFLMDPTMYTKKAKIKTQIQKILAKGPVKEDSDGEAPLIEDAGAKENDESIEHDKTDESPSDKDKHDVPVVEIENEESEKFPMIKIFRKLKSPTKLFEEFTQTIKSDKRIQRVGQFQKMYWINYLIAIPFVLLLFIFMLSLLWNFFTNIQIILFGIAGLASYFVIVREVRKDESTKNVDGKTEYLSTFKKVNLYYREALEYEAGAITKTAVLVLGVSLILTFLILYYTMGQNLLVLIPQNKRAYNLLFFVPFVFIMLFNQYTVFRGSLNPVLPKKVKGDIIAILLQIINKYGVFILMGLIGLPFGNYMIMIIGLLIVFDIVGSILTILSIRYSNHAFIAIIWTSLVCSIVYVGYAGIINSWDALFGEFPVLQNINI